MSNGARWSRRPVGAWRPAPVRGATSPSQTLSRLRWATIAALLVPALLEPTTGRLGLASWMLVFLFAAYNLIAGLLRAKATGTVVTIMFLVADLAAAGLVYMLGGTPGGPLMILIALVVLCTAVIVTLRGTIVYTAAAALLLIAIEVSFPGWSLAMGDVQELGARVIGLGLIGAGMTVIARQLSIEQQATRFRQDEAERLAELDRLRRGFVAAVSHDLRTPLTAVQAGLGMLEANASGYLPPEERRLLNNARRNADRLGWLINDLIAVNQLESGVMTLERRRFDLRATVVEAVSLVHPLLDEKRQTLALDIPAPLPVQGDSRRLEQVVLNLLVNAHQHTPEGTRINVAGCRQAGEVLLLVRDNGPGIPLERLEEVFERFRRLVPHGSGSGLGLAIARGLVEAHRGRIWAESERGTGTAISLCLPAAGEPGEEQDVAEAPGR